MASSYSSFLLKNASRISSIESSLRSLTWFLPGRFQDADLASEALYAAMNLLGIYHDAIIVRATDSLPEHQQPNPSSHSRYTRFWSDSSANYRVLARSLTVLGYTQLLVEMAAHKKWGKEKKWRLIVTIEVIKALLRLSLMQLTDSRPVIHPPIPEREVDPSTLDNHVPLLEGTPPNATLVSQPNNGDSGEGQTSSPPNRDHDVESWRGARTSKVRPTIASIRGRSQAVTLNGANGHRSNGHARYQDTKKDVNAFLYARVLNVEDVKRPEDLVRPLEGVEKAAEVVWILRPLLYVLAIKRYGGHHQIPFLLSLAVEHLARVLRQRQGKGIRRDASKVEKNEWNKRHQAFWWYLVRGPMWESFTKPQVDAVANLVEGKPLLGIMGTFLKDYASLIDSYHYYTSS